MNGSASKQSSVVGDVGVGLVGEVVVEESVAASVVAFNLEEELGATFVGEVGCACKVHEAADVGDFAGGGDGEPLVEEGRVGWAVAEVGAEGDLEETPVLVGDVGGIGFDVGIGVGPGMVARGLAGGCAVLWMRVELAEGLLDMGEVEWEEGGGTPVVGVAEGGESGCEDGVWWAGLAWVRTGFEVGDTAWVGDGLDADLGVEVKGSWGGRGYLGEGFVVFDEGPGGDRGEEVSDGFEAGFVVAGGVVGAPLLARLIEEDADSGLALVVAVA